MSAKSGCDNLDEEEEEAEEEDFKLGSMGEEDQENEFSADGHVIGCCAKVRDPMSEVLEDFRKQWQSEILNHNSAVPSESPRPLVHQKESVEVVTNANADIRCMEPHCLYKSDRHHHHHHHHHRSKRLSENESDDDDGGNSSDGGSEGDCSSDKIIKITAADLVCKAEFKQQSAHISSLPMEILTYIFKWVVSTGLDVDSLERLSMVCKSFYYLARDEDLWKSICMRTWEKSPLLSYYSSYRNMFIERPHVRFNGCYISKSTYFRQGEKSFDGLYKPYHIVEYFRYIRFYPEGKVYMLMSPDQPKTALVHLRNKTNYVQGLQYGYYKLTNDKLNLVLKKKPEPPSKYKRYVRNTCPYAEYEQTYYLEMSLSTIGRKRNYQLSWLSYSVNNTNKTTGESATMTFDLSTNKYPPLYFSPVKSFSAQNEVPL